ncbi:MAG: flagellar biosynthetic protein FliQ [Rhodospirillales bacterium]|nr:MAG: flagellar biosynthetic protein FliQ [Rhodospirillales bacterium]
MNELAVIDVGREALYVILKIAAPVMLAGMAIGLVVALFQALTTIQEMTLTFVPKILVIFVSMILFLPFMIATLVEFTHDLFHLIVAPQ